MADRRLQVFHAVAKHLSFTKAAETLFMTQPAVTSQVKQLEEHLNTRLFDRAQGRIALTPAGQVAFEYDRPAFVFGQFGNDKVDEVALKLDRDLRALLEKAAS